MKKIIINKKYTKDSQKEYLKVPFLIEEEFDHLVFEYSYKRFDSDNNEINIVDIGLFDNENNFRGWSGSNKTKIYISEIFSTPGYQKVVLNPGQWYIALGLYKIKDIVDIEIKIELYPKKYSWLSCDLHMHTVNSDGEYKTKEVIGFCKKLGLDCIALTDHNNTEQDKESISDNELSIIHGMEYTNYRGHANIFFTGDKTDFILNPLTNSFEEMKELFVAMKAQGCIISLNHIFDTSCPWDFGFKDFPYDVIEIWNGFMTNDNMKAIEWWQSYISKGNKLPIIGGSDTHKMLPFRTYASPTTFIYSDSKSPDNLLKSIKNGNCTVSYYLDGPQINFMIDKAFVGQTIKYKENLNGTLSVKSIKKNQEVLLISDFGEEKRWIARDNHKFTEIFPIEKRLFYRVEIYQKLEGVLILTAISNPIYIR